MSRKENAALVMTGVLVGTMLTGPAVHAAEEYFKAYRSNQATYLDGQQIQLEAYTMVSDGEYSAVKRLMGRLDCGTTYDHHVPPNLTNYYEHLDYFAMSAETPENYKNAIEFIQPAVQAAKRLGTDAEKVTYLNDYLKTLLEYDRDSVAGITQIFSQHSGEIKGACAAYARAFKVLCGETGIPCFTISTDIHTWNMVYVNGEWLHVDVSINDMPAGNTLLLERTVLRRVDVAPDATEFLKELLVPGSTK